jgi:hypothetical protein
MHTGGVVDAMFGEAEAFDWVRSHHLVTQKDVALFAAEAQGLPEASHAALSVVVRTGGADERRLAVAALRCRGSSVFHTGKGLAIGLPPATFNVFRPPPPEVLMPDAGSLRIAALLADVPTREIKLVPGSKTLERWLRTIFGGRSR